MAHLRMEATMLEADLLLSKDQLPPQPTENNGMQWRNYIKALKKKKSEIGKKVMDVRKQCQKIRKGLAGQLPVEPKIPQLPMWEQYMNQLKERRQEILKMKSRAQDMARKLGDAANDLLTEPRQLNYRKWERYYRRAAKFINNIMPVQKQADKMKDELKGKIPEPPTVWEKGEWRDYVNELRAHKRKTKDLIKRVGEIRDEMKGNELPDEPEGLNYDAWTEHRLTLKEIQGEIDKIKDRAKRLQKEFKGTPELPFDEEADDESNKRADWDAYILDLDELIKAIEDKRKEAKIWIKQFVEKLGVPAEDMPPEPPKPYNEEDWANYIDKLTNMEEELDDLKEQAIALQKDECFNDNKERIRPLPKIRSPKQWTACVKEMTCEKNLINNTIEGGKKLTKKMEEGNKLPDEPADGNYENWQKYIDKVNVLKAKVEELFPYADILRDDTDKNGKKDARLADKIKRCRKPKNMSLEAWKEHLKKMEGINPGKKHKNVEEDADFKIGEFIKVTGFHFFKFPLHNGLGKISKVILLDPFTIGYAVTLEEGKWLNAQTNQFVEGDIDVAKENVVKMPAEVDSDLQPYLDKVRKWRKDIMKYHVAVEVSADAVKKIQDQIRLCSAWGKGVDVNALKNKEKKLRNKRTKTAGQGVVAGKKKAKLLKDIEAMEPDFLLELKQATSTWVWMNGIMRAGEVKNIIKYLEEIGFKLKAYPNIGPDKLGYEMGMAMEMMNRAKRAEIIAEKTLGDPDGYIYFGDGAGGDVDKEQCEKFCVSTDIGGQFKGHHPKPKKCDEDWFGWGNKRRNKTGILKIYGKVPT